MPTPIRSTLSAIAFAAGLLLAAPAQADTIVDWNQRANQVVVDAKLGTPPAIRVMALVQAATLDAVQAALQMPEAAAVEAAVAAANRKTLLALLPAQQPAIDAAYDAAIAALPATPQREAGIAAGEQAAAGVLAARAGDMPTGPDTYRPQAVPGRWVPTAAAAATQWPQRKPWLLVRADRFRPGPPPTLASAAWVADYNEVLRLGARTSTERSAEQTTAARFWEYSLPPIYFGVVESVALAPGRDAARNARLYAAAAVAMDDAMIAVFDAKYRYGFWRPVTAIRNGDLDRHPATPRDASWNSLIESPMHPEYPSGHAVLAGAVGAVLRADVGAQPPLPLATRSPTAGGAARQWTTVDDFVREVGEARIWAGIHFRSAIDAGWTLGDRVGQLAVTRLLASEP